MHKTLQKLGALALAGAMTLTLFSGAAPAALAADSTPAASKDITGTFQFDPHEGSTEIGDLTDSFIYNDNYFSENSSVANPHLATMSMQLAAASISSRSYDRSDDAYKTRSKNVVALLEKLDFANIEVNGNYNKKMEEDTMGVAVAHKTLKDGSVLLAIVPRSAGYESEWSGNFNVGTGEETGGLHEGFKTARDIALDFAKKYIKDSKNNFPTDKTVKVWIAGYSRGAAVANLIGAAIVDNAQGYIGVNVESTNVFDYTFGTPATVIPPKGIDPRAEKYKGIHNYYSDYDPVTMMPFSNWKFTRYGQDTLLNDPDQKDRMLNFLQQLNPTVHYLYTKKGGDPDNFTAMTFDPQTMTIQPDPSRKISQKDFFAERIAYLTAHRVGDRDTYVNDGYQDMLRTLMVLNFGYDGQRLTDLAARLQSDLYRDEATNVAELIFGYSLMQNCAEQYGDKTTPNMQEVTSLMEQYPSLKESLKQKMGIQYDYQLLLGIAASDYGTLAAKLKTQAVESLEALLQAYVQNPEVGKVLDKDLAERLTKRDSETEHGFAAPLVDFLSAFVFGVELNETQRKSNSMVMLAQLEANTAATIYANTNSYMRVHNNEVLVSWLRTKDSNYRESYTVTVNGTEIGKYQDGATVTINGTPGDRFQKAFKSWTTETEGVTFENANDVVTTFTMPAHPVSLQANYIDRISQVTLTVEKPTANQPLPATGTLTWTGGSKEVAVSWLEQVSSRTKPASGTAKSGTQYAVKAVVGDMLFAFDLSKNNVTVVYGTDSNQATDAFVDVVGSLYITGPAVTTLGEAPAPAAETCTVTINGTDTGVADSEGKQWSQTWKYTYTKGDKVTIDAPSEKDEQFEKWDSVPQGVTGDVTDASLTVDNIQSDITLNAVYNPVVKELDLTIPALKAGDSLANAVTSAMAKISNDYSVTGLINGITWLPADSTAAYGTAYTAKLTLDQEKVSSLNFILAEKMKVTVNGSDNDIISTVVQENGGYAIYVTFPRTEETRVATVTTPNNVRVSHSDAADGKWPLPSQTTLALSDGSRVAAPINWEVSGYDNNKTTAQTLNATGTVTIPEGIQTNQIATQANEALTTPNSTQIVNAKVYVDAIEQVKLPRASLKSGTYSGAQTIYLSCETEGATIYYTLDENDPDPGASGTIQYTGTPITLPNASATTKLKLLAVKKNMTNSAVPTYTYNIQRVSSSSSSKPAQKPEDKPAEEPKQDYKNCKHDSTCPLAKFTDLDVNAWYHDGVHDCLDKGLMAGYGDGTFGPNDSISRAQVVTVLWRMAKSPAPTAANAFTDVPAGTWYTDAVRWAAENGVVGGYGDGRFGPNDPVTREQLAAMFYRFAQQQGRDVSQRADLGSYADAASVDAWATEAIQWACGSGILNGMDGSLVPQGTATRAQTAAMLQRLSAAAQ